MALYPPIWQQLNSYPAQRDRMGLLASLWPNGGAVGAAPSAIAGTLTVNIPPGTIAVPLQAGQGVALCTWDAAVTSPALQAGPAAGNTRIDLVVAQVRDNTIDGGANNDFLFSVVTGTPAATNPAVPPVPTNAAAVCQVLVPATVANLNTATVTDVRPLLSPGASGMPALGAGAPLQYMTDSDGRMWVAKGGVNGGAWRLATDVLHARWWRNTAWNYPAGSSALPMDTMTYDAYTLLPGGASFTPPVPGIWRMRLQLGGQVATTPVPNWFQAFITQSGGNLAVGSMNVAMATSQVTTIADYTGRAVAGAAPWTPASAGGGGTSGIVGVAQSFVTIDYLGNG